MNNSNSFTREHTLMTKGVLIIMMLIHHLFTSDLLSAYGVSTILSDSKLYGHINGYCKMCISGFAFLTAFGLTHSLMAIRDNVNSNYFKTICKRLIKLGSSIIFICILAILFKRFIVLESIRELYDKGNGFSFIYIIIDMLGLATYFGTPTINITWWYMTYAILLIVAMPFIFLTYKRYRYLILPAGCLLSIVVLMGGACFSALLPSVLLGTAFAYEGWFDKIHDAEGNFLSRILRISLEVVGIIFSYLLYCNTDLMFSYVFAFLIPLIVFEVIAYVPILNSVLKFLGKHATNIFLTHTFIYYYFYTDFIYSFKKDWLILIIMLIICTILSILIELLKKICGYNLLCAKVISILRLE